jgi:malonate transporter
MGAGGSRYNDRAMFNILATTFPFFALVLCGYIAVRRHMLPQLAIPGMNGFVLYFALPCLLFRFGSSTPLAQLLDPGVFGVYVSCALLTVALTMVLALRRGCDWNNGAFAALVAAFPNTGFMGVPLLVALVGPSASGPVMVTLVIDLIITTSLCVALSRLGQAHGKGGGQASVAALRNALSGMLRNPMPWAILLGACASGIGLHLPGPVARTIGLLADAASPVALFTIGAVLARSHMNASGSTPLADVVFVAMVKLLVHPLLVLAVGHAAIAAGAPLAPSSLTVLVLVACLPSASNVAMLAERFGADTGRVARIILVSTALSFLTFSGAVALLFVPP